MQSQVVKERSPVAALPGTRQDMLSGSPGPAAGHRPLRAEVLENECVVSNL